MISFIVGLLVIVITFYIALIYSSATLGLLGFAEAALFVMAFVFLLWYRRKISATIEIPIAVVNHGEEATVLIRARNTAKFACMKISYKIRTDSSYGVKTKGRWYAGEAIYPGKNAYKNRVKLQYAGNYITTLEKIRIYDMTGIFYIDKKINRDANVMVFPQLIDVSVRISEHTRNFYGDSDIYDDFRPGEDSSEIFDVREFRDGDRLQQIHWKLSAKADELLIREDSQPLACPLVFLLEYRKEGRLTGKTRKQLNQEQYISVVASLVFSLMDAACFHYVSWFSQSKNDMVRIRVDDEESYYLFLTCYLSDTYGTVKMPLEDMYRDKYRGDQSIYTMVLTSNLKLELNKRVIAELDGPDWKKGLEQTMLIL